MHQGARTDPCGGRGVTRAPTATRNGIALTLEVGEPLLKEPQGSAVPPWDFDGFIEQPGGENDGKVRTAMESHRDFVLGDGDFGRHVDEIAENLARLGIVVAEAARHIA
jgi:hypothetical protein